MNELSSAVTAGGQDLDYALQLCATIDNALNAAGNQKRYQHTSRELVSILQLIQGNPNLQTPEIISYIQELIGTADNICSTLCQRKRNCIVSSIASAIKKKNYDGIFANLERQKETLALCISQFNANTLGGLTTTSNNTMTWVQSSRPGTENLDEQISREVSDLLPGKEGEKRKAKAPRTQHISSHKTQQAYPLQHSSIAVISDFEGNIQTSNACQVVGMDIGPNACETNSEIMRLTSGFTAHNNIHSGNGMQIIGQRVHTGAKARAFSGQYCNNVNRGAGDQVIGFSLE